MRNLQEVYNDWKNGKSVERSEMEALWDHENISTGKPVWHTYYTTDEEFEQIARSLYPHYYNLNSKPYFGILTQVGYDKIRAAVNQYFEMK